MENLTAKSVCEYLELINDVRDNVAALIREKRKCLKKTIEKQPDPIIRFNMEQFRKNLETVLTVQTNLSKAKSHANEKEAEYVRKNRCGFEYKMYYRGHESLSYDLIPSVLRSGRDATESYLYHKIISELPQEFPGHSHIDNLVKMQHFGSDTRLLDITANPLVALYFACLEKKDEAGIVYVFCVPDRSVKYCDSDKVTILSSLAALSYDDIQLLVNLKSKINQELSNFGISTQHDILRKLNQTEYQRRIEKDSAYIKLFNEIRRENPAFENRIKFNDLFDSLIVQPNKTNDRILKQDGAFILSGLATNKEDIVRSNDKFVIYKIHIEDKSRILKELENINITRATMFPDVDNVASFFKHKYYEVE